MSTAISGDIWRGSVADRTVLRATGLRKAYPGTVALDDVSFELYEGEVHALVGENGAGKSTLIKILSGHTVPDAGSLSLGEHAYGRLTPRQAREAGIGTVYQDICLVPGLTVAENICLSSLPGRRGLVDRAQMRTRAQVSLSELGIDIDVDAKVSSLSVAQAEFVAIAKALDEDLRVLIMDEVSAPFAEGEVAVLEQLVRKLAARGIAIIYVTHRLDEVYRMAERMTVMRDGRVVARTTPAETPRERLISLIVGREMSDIYPKREAPSEERVLEVRDLVAKGVDDVSFDLRRGEILGVAGLMGSGRSELARALFGAERRESGTVLLEGKDISLSSPSDAVHAGLGLVPQDRASQGVHIRRPVRENLSLAGLRSLCRGPWVNRSDEAQVVEEITNDLDVKASSPEQPVSELSGGNQQKVALGKWLSTDAKVLILNEPTQGVDVGAKYDIYRILADLTNSGVSVIMMSSEIEELVGMSDRIMVLHDGHMQAMLDERTGFDQALIMSYASGIA